MGRASDGPTRSGLLDRMRDAGGRTAPTCQMGAALAAMAADYRAAVMAALTDPTIAATGIAKVLRADGYKVGDDAAQRHRRKACACG